MIDGRNDRRTNSRGDPIDDEVFVAFRNRHRRYVLYYLSEHEAVPVDELADVLAGWEALESGFATRDDWAALRATLRHRHLPLLEDAGLIDRDDGRVTRADWAEPVPTFVRRGIERELESPGS